MTPSVIGLDLGNKMLILLTSTMVKRDFVFYTTSKVSFPFSVYQIESNHSH